MLETSDPSSDQQESECITAGEVRSNGPDALSELFESEEGRIQRLLSTKFPVYLIQRFSKSDVIQETFLRATKQIRYLGDDANLPAYLWLRKVCLEVLDQFSREHTTAKRTVTAEETVANSDILDRLASPRSQAVRSERINEILLAFERLPERDRELLQMFYVERLSYREIAFALDLESGTVRQRFSRAIKKLQKVLRKH